jgi:hypothetical protein
MVPNQLQAIGLLVSGFRSNEIAKQVGICSRTLRRWRRNPQFAKALYDAFMEQLEAGFDAAPTMSAPSQPMSAPSPADLTPHVTEKSWTETTSTLDPLPNSAFATASKTIEKAEKADKTGQMRTRQNGGENEWRARAFKLQFTQHASRNTSRCFRNAP